MTNPESKTDADMIEQLRAEFADAKDRCQQYLVQRELAHTRYEAAAEYCDRLRRILANESLSPRDKVLREQALLARLSKTDMSRKARLDTLIEAEQAGLLDEDTQVELLELRRDLVTSAQSRRRGAKAKTT